MLKSPVIFRVLIAGFDFIACGTASESPILFLLVIIWSSSFLQLEQNFLLWSNVSLIIDGWKALMFSDHIFTD